MSAAGRTEDIGAMRNEFDECPPPTQETPGPAVRVGGVSSRGELCPPRAMLIGMQARRH